MTLADRFHESQENFKQHLAAPAVPEWLAEARRVESARKVEIDKAIALFGRGILSSGDLAHMINRVCLEVN